MARPGVGYNLQRDAVWVPWPWHMGLFCGCICVCLCVCVCICIYACETGGSFAWADATSWSRFNCASYFLPVSLSPPLPSLWSAPLVFDDMRLTLSSCTSCSLSQLDLFSISLFSSCRHLPRVACEHDALAPSFPPSLLLLGPPASFLCFSYRPHSSVSCPMYPSRSRTTPTHSSCLPYTDIGSMWGLGTWPWPLLRGSLGVHDKQQGLAGLLVTIVHKYIGLLVQSLV